MEAKYVLTTLNSAGYYQHNYFDSITEINKVIKEYNIKKYQIYDIKQDVLIKVGLWPLHRPSNNWQCQKIDGFMLWFGSWEIKPYNRNFWKFQNTQTANCYMLLQIPICYLLLLFAIMDCY